MPLSVRFITNLDYFNMKPLVSLCVPIYGVELYIEQCCRSLFEQTYLNIEYIFVDDCTKDKSIEILQRVLGNYPQRVNAVKIIRHERNKGLSGARNTAIGAVTGEYLMHIDSDDYLDLNVVETLVKKMQVEKADVVLYDMRYVYSDKQYLVHQHFPETKEECVKDVLTFKISACVWGGLYATRLFKDTGVKFIEGLNFGEDYVVKPRILYYARKIVHCSGCYYNYVQYNASSYTLSYKSKNIDDLIRAVSILDIFFKKQKDYDIYQNTLLLAHLQVKIKLLIDICMHRKVLWNRVPMISDLYKNKVDNYGEIRVSHRIILWLANCKLYNVLYVYVKLGFSLKQMFK